MTVIPDSPDIFEILDIEEREDTYSRLLVHLLRRSPGLHQRLLAHAFGADAPSAEPATVELRHKFSDGRVVDILLAGPEGPRRWALFIESKLFSGEHGCQTADYLKESRALVGATGRAEGIFLTIAGDRACEAAVVSLTHRDLTGWISEHMDDFRDHPALCIAAEAYARRARVSLPERAPDEALVRDILCARRWGLVPHLANVSALGATLRHELAGEWKHDAIWIQGPGHANPGLQFWLPDWCGSQIIEPNWTADNIYVHLEVELTESPPWRLKVHFETEPYYTQREVGQLAGHAGFATMRDAFRDALHAQHSRFPQWKLTWHKLQSAILAAPVGPDATVAQLRASFAPAMAEIAPCITHALTHARATMTPSSPALRVR
jgi:hypothetical protein